MFTFWKLVVVGVLVIAAGVVLFWAIGFLAGIAWFVIKVAIVIALLYVLMRFFLRSARKHTE